VGPRVLCEQGEQYTDTTGAGHTLALSHHVDLVREALAKASPSPLLPASGRHFLNHWQEKLSQRVRQLYGDPACLTYFTSGGTEAFEMAIQIAYHVQDLRGCSARRQVVGRKQSYHGMSLGAMSAGWHPNLRGRLNGALLQWPHLPEADCPCCLPTGCSTQCLRDAEELDTAAAVVIEPIGGTTSGAMPLAPEYLQMLSSRSRAAGTLLIADEVITGFGRCGVPFVMSEGLADITIGGKLLAGGLAPLCAVIVSGSIVREIRASGNAPTLRLTFSGNSLACAVGDIVQQVVDELEILSDVTEKGRMLDGLLRQYLTTGNVSVRGPGLLKALEWSVEKGRGRDTVAEFRDYSEKRAVIVMPGYREGALSDQVFTTVTPALDSTDEDLVLIAERLAEVVNPQAGKSS
jgi:adenosylmethionine-8-amino-7-oxononanoate aminotransferase